VRKTRKKETQSNWRFTMEQIGRELRSLYPSAKLPARLRTLLTKEKRKKQRCRTVKRSERDE
jgi:hypothetical protein